MASLDVKLTGDLTAGLDAYAQKVQGEVLISGAAAMAKVIYDEVSLNTSGARGNGKALDPPGVVTGTLHGAVYRVYSKKKSTSYVKTYHIGVNKKKAPHWHLVEYGTSRAPAHPYIRPAADHMPIAVAAGMARIRGKLGSSV